jgi:hypothetical protein
MSVYVACAPDCDVRSPCVAVCVPVGLSRSAVSVFRSVWCYLHPVVRLSVSSVLFVVGVVGVVGPMLVCVPSSYVSSTRMRVHGVTGFSIQSSLTQQRRDTEKRREEKRDQTMTWHPCRDPAVGGRCGPTGCAAARSSAD